MKSKFTLMMEYNCNVILWNKISNGKRARCVCEKARMLNIKIFPINIFQPILHMK